MVDGAAALRRPPVLDPELSLGWDDGPLDGLSCLLRCVESALRAQGLSNPEIAQALAVPLDLRGDRRRSSSFRHGHLHWRNAVDGRQHWAEFVALVESGTPCVLMPDRYYWPGDEFEGVKHFLDHMVLAVAHADGVLEVLDTDAPPSDGYRRWIPVTPEVVRGCCRFATVHVTPVPDDAATLRATLLEPTATALGEDLPALRTIERRWRRDGLTGSAARALHVVVLGAVQPSLFLIATAVRQTHPGLADELLTASRAAQRLGKALIGAHRWAGAQADDTSVYDPVLGAFTACEAALTRLSDELHRQLGLQPPPAADPDQDDDGVWRRVVRNQAWCYGDQVAPARSEESTR
ncbi:hypothetical protein [Micromonospora halophytica]|uniref:NlpC/p60-like transpeptidase n=1 Tax=Micromonospora halophytica TaxID=47864 RepID=A0A1C5ILU1_9ACTN|nr:hypothetical protein [Micromonospora halophytica]SCG59275.1 hypothetical protein GA0070560_11391 [Micromonospora halophytica]